MINLNATLLIQLANFLLLMFLLNRLLFRPMRRILEERQARTEGRREAAEQKEAAAERTWADYQAQLREARGQAEQERLKLVRAGEAEKDKILQAAAAQAETTLNEIRTRVRAEAEQARQALRGEADRLAGDMAERILGRSL